MSCKSKRKINLSILYSCNPHRQCLTKFKLNLVLLLFIQFCDRSVASRKLVSGSNAFWLLASLVSSVWYFYVPVIYVPLFVYFILNSISFLISFQWLKIKRSPYLKKYAFLVQHIVWNSIYPQDCYLQLVTEYIYLENNLSLAVKFLIWFGIGGECCSFFLQRKKCPPIAETEGISASGEFINFWQSCSSEFRPGSYENIAFFSALKSTLLL